MNRTRAFIFTLICLSLLPANRADALPACFAGKILEEINLARSQPHRYADYLRRLRSGSEGSAYKVPGSPLPIQTREGTEAVDEAIRFLEHQKPVPALSWSPGLAAAAHELAREQSETGSTGHTGNSGGVRERIARQGRWKGRIGENIAYGPGNPRGMVMQLIINDGVPERGHRRNIFRRSFAVSGIACAPHPHYGGLCVMDFAGRFLD